jgi:hypothetical protein
MRKHLVWVLALVVVFGVYGIAHALNTQTIQTTFVPNKKLPPKSKRGKPAKLRTAVSTRDAQDPSKRPSPSEVFNVDFDKDVKFNTDGVKKCTANITSASTTTATSLCKASKISFGASVPYGGTVTPQNAAVVQPAAGGNINAVVTAFNGPKQGGKPTILLHTSNPVTGTTVLTGVLQGSTQAGYAKTLVVTTPKLAGGNASIIDFTVTVKKNYTKRIRGKKVTVGYIGVNCKDKKLKTQARVQFQDQSTATATSVQKCTKRPS